MPSTEHLPQNHHEASVFNAKTRPQASLPTPPRWTRTRQRVSAWEPAFENSLRPRDGAHRAREPMASVGAHVRSPVCGRKKKLPKSTVSQGSSRPHQSVHSTEKPAHVARAAGPRADDGRGSFCPWGPEPKPYHAPHRPGISGRGSPASHGPGQGAPCALTGSPASLLTTDRPSAPLTAPLPHRRHRGNRGSRTPTSRRPGPRQRPASLPERTPEAPGIRATRTALACFPASPLPGGGGACC